MEMDENPAYEYPQVFLSKQIDKKVHVIPPSPAKPRKCFVYAAVLIIYTAVLLLAVVSLVVVAMSGEFSASGSECNATSVEVDFENEFAVNNSNLISQLYEEIEMLKSLTYNITNNTTNACSEFPSNFASKCNEIFRQYNMTATTGTYWLNNSAATVNVKCDFDVQLPPPSSVRGWQEIANINLSDPTNFCPSPLKEITSPRRCEKSSDCAGCVSVFFPTNRVPFSKLCGRVGGYANGTADAFASTHGVCGEAGCKSIDSPYVDGISITYLSSNRREHVWSLAAQFSPYAKFRCPCEAWGLSTPSFVANEYYCEEALSSTNSLWNSEGCDDVHATDVHCCENPNLPWFCREFDQSIVTDSIEVRLCTDEDHSNEVVQFDLLKLYIQ